MLNKELCQKCSVRVSISNQYFLKQWEYGEVLCPPMIATKLSSYVQTEDEPPDRCIYRLEQIVSMQNVE